MNGVKLHLNEKGELPDLSPKEGKGSINVDPYSIVYITILLLYIIYDIF